VPHMGAVGSDDAAKVIGHRVHRDLLISATRKARIRQGRGPALVVDKMYLLPIACKLLGPDPLGR